MRGCQHMQSAVQKIRHFRTENANLIIKTPTNQPFFTQTAKFCDIFYTESLIGGYL